MCQCLRGACVESCHAQEQEQRRKLRAACRLEKGGVGYSMSPRLQVTGVEQGQTNRETETERDRERKRELRRDSESVCLSLVVVVVVFIGTQI